MIIVPKVSIKYKGKLRPAGKALEVVKAVGEKLIEAGHAIEKGTVAPPVDPTAEAEKAEKAKQAAEAKLIAQFQSATTIEALNALMPNDEASPAVAEAFNTCMDELEATEEGSEAGN